MWEQHIAAVSSEVPCLWLLTWKDYLTYPLAINVIVIFSRVLRSIHEVRSRNELAQLILMSVIFSTTKVLYNISGLGGLAIFKYPPHFPGTCPRFFINGHNAQLYCIKGKWHHRRYLYYNFGPLARSLLIRRQVPADGGCIWNILWPVMKATKFLV